jgi:hypothetical protein
MSSAAEALSHAGVLQEIVAYLGPGHWLCAALVNRAWKLWYSKVDTTVAKRTYPNATHMKDYIHLTGYGAAFMSVSRFRLALEHGLQGFFASFILQQKAGLYADTDTLLAAQAVGLPITYKFMQSAAVRGHISVLQLLRTQQRRDLPPDVSAHAAAYGRTELLRWLQSVGCTFTALTTRGAAEGGHVQLLEFLLSAGCPIDDSASLSAVKGGSLATLQVCCSMYTFLSCQSHC